MKILHIIAFSLLIIGGLNWGLIGLGAFLDADWDVISMILGSWQEIEWFVFVLIGLSAVWMTIDHKKTCRNCSSS